MKILSAIHTLITGLLGVLYFFMPDTSTSHEPFAYLYASHGISHLTMSVISAMVLAMENHKHAVQLGLFSLIIFNFGQMVLEMVRLLDSETILIFPLYYAAMLIGFSIFLFKKYQ